MRTRTIVMSLAALAACKGKDVERDRAAPSQIAAGSSATEARAPEEPAPDNEDSPGTAMALEEGKMGKKDTMGTGRYGTIGHGSGTGSGYGVGGGKGGMRGRAAAAPSVDLDGDIQVGDDDRKQVPEGPTRAWFPETFLFEPLIVTDAGGSATVKVRVPDRLTSWRVLALAHARTGAQGGATTSFLGTLPTYVDLVTPEVLVRGDEVRLPVQLVNTTSEPVTTTLLLEATNATITGGGTTRTIPAGGSVIEYARLVADRPGTVGLRAALRGGDAIERTIEVLPVGQPVVDTHTGTLAAPRTLALTGPAGSDPATDRVRLRVYPGALALLRSELGASTARGGLADDAYALLLAGRARALLAALGDTPDEDNLRRLRIMTTQRAVRVARTLDVERATLLAEAALAHPGDPVLTRLGERAAASLVTAQRPDGTFGGGAGWSLQRVLVATADATRAVRAAMATPAGKTRALNVSVRASAAFERSASQVEDAYTAAAMLASGAVSGPLVDTLRARVVGAIQQAPDGARYLEPAAGVVRADGERPSIAEATALAALALAGVPDAPLPDLGATLLGSYDPAVGWGDGRANLLAITAVVELFRAPIPSDVTITLTMDGKAVAEGVLARDKLREVLTLDVPAPGLAGAHTWQLTATPAVPGLGYALDLRAWVPWKPAAAAGGLELALPPTLAGAVGKPIALTVRAVAPSGVELRLEHALPAGVQPDSASLQALVDAGTITSFKTAAGKLTLTAPALEPGQTFAAGYRVIPTLAGTLRSAPSKLSAGDAELLVPPSAWTIR